MAEPNQAQPNLVTPEVRRAVLDALEHAPTTGLTLPEINQRIPYGWTRIELTLDHLYETGHIAPTGNQVGGHQLYVLTSNLSHDESTETS